LNQTARAGSDWTVWLREQKRKRIPLRWVVESIEEERSYLEKPMFGCLAVYLHGGSRFCYHPVRNPGMDY